MTNNEAIDVLKIIRRKELAENAKTNKLCTNPSESIGAKAIEFAIEILIDTEGLAKERDEYKELFDAVLKRGVALERAVIDYAPCWACKHEESCENNNSQWCCNSAFEYDVLRFAIGGYKSENL